MNKIKIETHEDNIFNKLNSEEEILDYLNKLTTKELKIMTDRRCGGYKTREDFIIVLNCWAKTELDFRKDRAKFSSPLKLNIGDIYVECNREGLVIKDNYDILKTHLYDSKDKEILLNSGCVKFDKINSHGHKLYKIIKPFITTINNNINKVSIYKMSTGEEIIPTKEYYLE